MVEADYEIDIVISHHKQINNGRAGVDGHATTTTTTSVNYGIVQNCSCNSKGSNEDDFLNQGK